MRSQISTKSNMDAVWNVLTTYEKFSDYFAHINACEIVEKQGNRTRVTQSGQKSLPLGIKIKTHVVIDFVEKEVETLPSGKKKRVIDFKFAEGDFDTYEGYWGVEQTESNESIISYSLSMKPKSKIPVPMGLLESSLKDDCKKYLACIRDAAAA